MPAQPIRIGHVRFAALLAVDIESFAGAIDRRCGFNIRHRMAKPCVTIGPHEAL
jgi:hypothetical protein